MFDKPSTKTVKIILIFIHTRNIPTLTKVGIQKYISTSVAYLKRFNRNALATTQTLDIDMAKAANIGFS